MQVFVDRERMSSRIGSVYDAPVDADIKIKDSYACQLGGAPYGPAIKPISEDLDPTACFAAYLLILFENPDCALTANWISWQ